MNADEQEYAVEGTASFHADEARDWLDRDNTAEATVHALLAIEGRLNEICYRLNRIAEQ
jgi:hypothetical protein